MELTNRLSKTLLGAGLAVALGLTLADGNPALAQGSWESSVLSDVAAMPDPVGDLPGATTGGKLYVVGSIGPGAEIPNFPFIYDPVSDSWSSGLVMPDNDGDPRRQAGMRGAAIAGKVYVVGGASNTNSNTPTGASFVYDPGSGPGTDSWTQITSMPTARLAPAVAVIDGKLYAVGGWSHCGLTCLTYNNLDVYDPVADTWTTKNPMPTSRESPGAGVIDGKLYVVGGLFRNPTNRPWDAHVIDTLEIYDPATNTWDTSKAPMPTPRKNAAVAVIGGRLHVVGGLSFEVVPSGSTGIFITNEVLATHEVYDPATDTWQSLPPAPTARRSAGAGVIDDRLYVAGGLGSSGTLDILEVFTPVRIDHFQCYKAKIAKGELKFTPLPVNLVDQFGETVQILEKPAMLCVPVDKNGEGIQDPVSHLTCYELEEPDDAVEFEKLDVAVNDQFGELILTVKKPKFVCVPSTKEVLE